MKLQMFSVLDVKAAAYITPFCLPTVAMAKRAFLDCVAQDGHAFHAHPEDYVLFRVGEFDVETGVLTPCSPIAALATGVDARVALEASEEVRHA